MSLVMMGVAIEIVNDVTGLTEWSQAHESYFILNETTCPGIMISFSVILSFIGFCMVLMHKAFTMDDDSEIPL